MPAGDVGKRHRAAVAVLVEAVEPAQLLDVLGRLVDAGNTVVVIEHNLDVVKSADWVLDLGPEAGDRGGRIVACGTPEQVARSRKSHTARYLRPLLADGRAGR